MGPAGYENGGCYRKSVRVASQNPTDGGFDKSKISVIGYDMDSTESTPITESPARVGAIDILRALTMVLMIFVNDLWSLKDIPAWLGHVESGVDGMGLADTVFPAFLFIVGLSLPFAIDARRRKGEGTGRQVVHVLGRSLALLVMGVFLVNGETINGNATGLSRGAWNALSCVSFILIWNSYPKSMSVWLQRGLKLLGVVALAAMAFVYRGGEGDVLFGPQWWGILGLIGWAYLGAALVTVLARGHLAGLVAGWLFFAGISLAWAAGLVPEPLHVVPEPLIGGTLAALVMGGVVIGRLFQIWQPKGENGRMTVVFVAITVALVALYAVTRPAWGLSKLGATPAWLFLCSALTLVPFTIIYWIADVARQGQWFAFVKPAGTDTLLSYLIPYFAYAAFVAFGLGLPDVMLTGGIGLIKSLVFALVCVWIAGGLSKLGVRLKL
jgi:heparan-alpha-glucosaminide N-acetyltransferase